MNMRPVGGSSVNLKSVTSLRALRAPFKEVSDSRMSPATQRAVEFSELEVGDFYRGSVSPLFQEFRKSVTPFVQ